MQELYRYCEIAREMLKGKYGVGRVIARPFLGNSADTFYRTKIGRASCRERVSSTV